jgi:hypothetical protein
MSASEFEQKSFDDLIETQRQVDLQHSIATQHLRQLVERAFDNPARAGDFLLRCIRRDQTEHAVRALEGGNQVIHLGFQRKAFLGFGKSHDPDVAASRSRGQRIDASCPGDRSGTA